MLVGRGLFCRSTPPESRRPAKNAGLRFHEKAIECQDQIQSVPFIVVAPFSGARTESSFQRVDDECLAESLTLSQRSVCWPLDEGDRLTTSVPFHIRASKGQAGPISRGRSDSSCLESILLGSPGFYSHSVESCQWIRCRLVSVTFRCCNLQHGLDPDTSSGLSVPSADAQSPGLIGVSLSNQIEFDSLLVSSSRPRSCADAIVREGFG